jgi:hypothetical protein
LGNGIQLHSCSWKLLRWGFAARVTKRRLGQLHNSLNGGSVGHGGIELKLAPPPDADTLVPDAPLDADTPVDDRPDP